MISLFLSLVSCISLVFASSAPAAPCPNEDTTCTKVFFGDADAGPRYVPRYEHTENPDDPYPHAPLGSLFWRYDRDSVVELSSENLKA